MKTILYLKIFLASIMIITSCSGHFYPAPALDNIDSQVDRQRLNNFMTGGTGKELDVYSTNTDAIIHSAEEYLGNNEFIHASSSQGVCITSLNNSYWKGKFLFGTRIFSE